jgi:cobyrinic acid a,c-diamide synthase
LARSLTGFDGTRRRMAGVLPVDIVMDSRFLAIRYVEACTKMRSPLGPVGTRIRGQEFHQSRIASADIAPGLFEVTSSTGETRTEGYLVGSVMASYLHLHLASHPGVLSHLLHEAVNATGRTTERRADAVTARTAQPP